jgi:hypothetical protein
MSIRAPDIIAAMKLRYPLPEWALMFQVANGTGASQSRYADALAMNLYPSRGLELHGFEIKVDRRDWQRELANPDKAESIARFCERWWVAAPKEIVKREELPAGWGLIEFDGKTLKQAVAAPLLTAQPLDRPFIAAMLRRSAEIDQAVVKAVVDAKVAELRARDEQHQEEALRQRTRDLQAKIDRVDAIERQIGMPLVNIDFNNYGTGEDIGRAIKMIIATGLPAVHSGLRRFAVEQRETADKLDRHFAVIDGVAPHVEHPELLAPGRRRRA